MWERGFNPPTVGSFFIFLLENVQSGAYLRRKFRLDDMNYIIITCMELKISHDIIEGGGFARERSDQARGSLATERGEGFPSPTVGSFFIFRLENVQSGAYLRRKF